MQGVLKKEKDQKLVGATVNSVLQRRGIAQKSSMRKIDLQIMNSRDIEQRELLQAIRRIGKTHAKAKRLKCR